MPFFSIAVPVYNSEKYISKCINSILQQTFENFEIIIIDDGTKDQSGKMADEFQDKDNRIHVYHTDNQGLLLARREALKYAIGEYVLFLDADDYWERTLLETVYNAIQKYHTDLAMFRYKVFDDNGNEYHSQRALLPNETVIQDVTPFLINKLATDFEYNAMWLKAVRLSCMDTDNTYRQYAGVSIVEDVLQSVGIAKGCNTMVYLDVVLHHYRINMKSITRSASSKHMSDYIIGRQVVMQQFYELFGEDTKALKKGNSYVLQGFLSFMVELAHGLSKDEFSICLNMMKTSTIYQKIVADIKQLTWKGKVYRFLLLNNCSLIYKMLYGIKQLTKKIYFKLSI